MPKKPLEMTHKGFKLVKYVFGNGNWVIYDTLGHQLGPAAGIAGLQIAETFIDNYIAQRGWVAEP